MAGTSTLDPVRAAELLAAERRRSTRGRDTPQQSKRIDAGARGQPLEALQRQVALTALDAAHVRAVNAELIGKSFLAETARLSEHAKVAPHGPLKVALHNKNGVALLLDGLQTDA